MRFWLQKSFSRLKFKVLLFGLMMSILPFLILGLINIQISKDRLVTEIDSANEAFLENGVYQLETLFSHTFETMYVLRDALEANQLTEADHFYLLSSFMKNIPYVESVSRLSSESQELFKIDRWSVIAREELKKNQDPRLLDHIRKGRPYIGQVSRNKEGKMMVDLAIPGSQRPGKSGGILVQVNLKQLFDELMTKARLNKASYLYVLDQKAKLIADPIPVAGNSSSKDVGSSHLTQIFKDVPEYIGKPVQHLYQNTLDEQVTGYAMRVPSTNWIIVLEQSARIAFASYYKLELNLLLSTLLIVLLVSVVSVYFAIKFSKPIERIEAGVRRLAHGDLSSRIEILTTDELGRLSRTFNEMAISLEKKTKEIMEEKKRLDIVVSGMGMGLILINENYQIEWVNQTILTWFGNQENLIGIDCSDAFGHHCRLCSHCPIKVKNMIETNGKEMISSRYDKEGKLRYFRHQIFYLNPERDRSSFLEVIEDITEKREMEDAVVQSDKLAAIGLLASGFAHEINNPLGILSVYSEDLKERLAEESTEQFIRDGEMERYLETIQKQIDRCKRITSNLLNFSRKSSEFLEKMDIHQSLDETVALLEHEIRKKHVIIQRDYRAANPYIHAPNGEIQQVLFNVMTNAMYAMGEEGRISISTNQTIDDEVLIEIQDSGKGIPPKDLSLIFDPFFTTKPVGKGTGLGLSVCYGILKRLGGSIQIQSEVGLGTRVFIRIPSTEGVRR